MSPTRRRTEPASGARERQRGWPLPCKVFTGVGALRGERELMLEAPLNRLAAGRGIAVWTGPWTVLRAAIAPIDGFPAPRYVVRIRIATVHEVVALVCGQLIRLAALGLPILACDHRHLGVIRHRAALRAGRIVVIAVEDVGAGIRRLASEIEVTAIRALDLVLSGPAGGSLL